MQWRIQNPVNIEDEEFWENNEQMKAMKCFLKMLHLRCLTGS